ncbi:hypothetical protein N8311_00535 [bacterium]|nr:hypothetical protein [bacterium]
MKSYKFVLFVLSLLILGTIIVLKYIEMPAPHKVQSKILDVNDDAVR